MDLGVLDSDGTRTRRSMELGICTRSYDVVGSEDPSNSGELFGLLSRDFVGNRGLNLLGGLNLSRDELAGVWASFHFYNDGACFCST